MSPKRPRIVLVAHTKGGVSKSTLTIHLAVMLANAGLKVGLYDVDLGQSVSRWARTRARLHPDLVQIPVAYKEGNTAHLEILEEAEQFDVVLVDAGGEGVARVEIGLVMTVADTLITPCRPNGADVQRLDNIHYALSKAVRFNKTLRPLLVPTQASTNVHANDLMDFYRDAAQYPYFTIARSVISNRTAFGLWGDHGVTATETKPRDRKAIAEIEQLYKEVFNEQQG